MSADAVADWLDTRHSPFTLRGLAWAAENESRWSRLPGRAEGRVRLPVWDLAQSPASAHLAFRSDTTAMSARVALHSKPGMNHMPASGSGGLYLYSGSPTRLRPWAAAIPDMAGMTYERELFANQPRQLREFRLYLPLYQSLATLELKLSAGAQVLPPSPCALPRPVVFYGTSITQGGCAATAGSDFVSVLGRRLNLEMINLGFSGNGQGEPELAEFIREIDAALYVLDYAANVGPEQMRDTLPVFIRTLRETRPETPILLVTTVCFSRFDFTPDLRLGLEAKRDFMIETYIQTRRAGDANIHLADGFSLIPFGADGAYVDGVHPTDHGFQLMADGLAPVIERILLRADQV